LWDTLDSTEKGRVRAFLYLRPTSLVEVQEFASGRDTILFVCRPERRMAAVLVMTRTDSGFAVIGHGYGTREHRGWKLYHERHDGIYESEGGLWTQGMIEGLLE